MHKRHSDKYFRKIVEALNECDIRLEERPRVEGKTVGGWYRDDIIVIRYRPQRENMLLTLIHEALHHIYPDLNEFGDVGEGIDLLSRSLLCEFSTDQLKALSVYLRR